MKRGEFGFRISHEKQQSECELGKKHATEERAEAPAA